MRPFLFLFSLERTSRKPLLPRASRLICLGVKEDQPDAPEIIGRRRLRPRASVGRSHFGWRRKKRRPGPFFRPAEKEDFIASSSRRNCYYDVGRRAGWRSPRITVAGLRFSPFLCVSCMCVSSRRLCERTQGPTHSPRLDTFCVSWRLKSGFGFFTYSISS